MVLNLPNKNNLGGGVYVGRLVRGGLVEKLQLNFLITKSLYTSFFFASPLANQVFLDLCFRRMKTNMSSSADVNVRICAQEIIKHDLEIKALVQVSSQDMRTAVNQSLHWVFRLLLRSVHERKTGC